MITTALITQIHHDVKTNAQRPPSTWIADLLLQSTHMVCLACPLCCGLNTKFCVLCETYLCPAHDLACLIAMDAICQTCWRSF